MNQLHQRGSLQLLLYNAEGNQVRETAQVKLCGQTFSLSNLSKGPLALGELVECEHAQNIYRKLNSLFSKIVGCCFL